MLAVGVGSAMTLAWNIIRPRRMTAEEVERQRRTKLAAYGRIIDGVIVDAPMYHAEETAQGEPALIAYRYRIAGVIYECSQDVSTLQHEVEDFRVDLPVSIKYDPRNPANSIVVAETWSGLRDGSEAGWQERTGTSPSSHA